MSTSTPSSPDIQDFMDGGIRDAVGLTSDALRFGLSVAKREMDRGDHATALGTYASLAACEPATVDYHVGMANCAVRLELYELGLSAATAALALAPRDPRGWLLSGRCCLALGRREQAREDLDTAADLGLATRAAPLVAEARRLLGVLAA